MMEVVLEVMKVKSASNGTPLELKVLGKTTCHALGGTSLFLTSEEGKARPFTVMTRFQTFGSFGSLEKAVARFDAVLSGKHPKNKSRQADWKDFLN